MKIALFVGQIYIYTQREIIRGIYEECKKNGDELHLFSFYVSNDEKFDLGEYEYINRMDISGFDGFILYASAFYNPYIRGLLVNKIKASDKPVVSIDSHDANFYNVTSCNSGAMEGLVEHIISEHNVKTVNFVGGPADSTDALDRLNACRRVMEAHGLTLPDERIFTGNYYVDSGYKAYDHFKANGMMDADAFVCVNDQTAMGVFYKATEDGYTIPDDFIITGFDHIPQASFNEPSITSIERFESRIGQAAYEGLWSNEKKEVTIAPKLARGSSCCKGFDIDNTKRASYLRECIKLSLENSRYAGFISDSAADFMAYRSSDEMYEMLPSYQKKFNIPEMAIVLDKEEAKKVLDVPYHYSIDGDEKKSKLIRRDEIFSSKGEGNMYVYSSLHYGGKYFGYVITTNYFAATETELYHMFINNISNMYESAAKYDNQEEYINKLRDLSYYDPLTKIYNRLGFFNKAEDDFEKAKNAGENMYIIFADLDRLKVINDTMGHKMGDSYIVDFVNILTSCIDGYDTPLRFGGDEFVVFGISTTEEEVRAKINHIQEEIRKFNEQGKYSPYILGVSMGYTMISSDTKKTLFSYIETADQKMYKVKREKKDERSGKDRRSGRDRRTGNRRGLNDPINLS